MANYLYFDLVDGEVVEYRPDKTTHDPSEMQLLICETAVGDGISVWTVFDGKVEIDEPDPPKVFWTDVRDDYGLTIVEGYISLADAKAGHDRHVRRTQEKLKCQTGAASLT